MDERLYYQDDMVFVKSLAEGDVVPLANAFVAQNSGATVDTFRWYLREQERDARIGLVALYGGVYAGYLTIARRPVVGLFSGIGIPEIADFRVLTAFQRRGIGAALLDVAEGVAAGFSQIIGIGVGLHGGYGAIQRLCVRRGYLPTGSGIWHNGKLLAKDAPCRNDDNLVLYFTKQLTRTGE